MGVMVMVSAWSPPPLGTYNAFKYNKSKNATYNVFKYNKSKNATYNVFKY